MNDQELKKSLSMLGYTARWLEYGLLTEILLWEQLSTFAKENDKNTEHYRYATFRNYLAAKDFLTDLELDHYMELALSDHDNVMAGAALVDLFTRANLSDDQFDKLITQLKGLGDWTNNTVTRQTLLRKLKQEKLTDTLFRECIEQGDAVVQEYIIPLSNAEQLTALSVEGRTKKIKTMASRFLNP